MQSNANKKIKILQIAGGFRKNVNGKVVSGGVPSFLNNYYSKIDRNRFHFDFLAIRNQCFEPYREGFEKTGSKLYAFDIQSDGMKRFFLTIKKLSKFLKDSQYDAVHINMGSFFPVLTCAMAAKKAGVKNVIAHSHSSGIFSKRKKILIDLLSPMLTLFADKYCACSLEAAQNLFSKRIIKNNKYQIIRNAIDVDKFNFDRNIRDDMRSELGYDKELVIGHVGRFVEVKNHDFLIDFFAEFNKKNPNSKLLLLGNGELKSKIKNKVDQVGLKDQVIFKGQQNQVHRYYQAMDLFVMPSLVEGFGIVAIEAQSTGLPCYLSSQIPNEVKITNLCKTFDLKESPEYLAKTVNNDVKNYGRRKDYSAEIIEAGFDLLSNVNIFESLYL